jgi:multiple sugar transport system ATP-binding protein
LGSIRFEDVTKRFGHVVALDRLTLDIEDGELMVLLGPSGCGKTTALQTIAGVEDITEGRLFIDDRVVNDVEPAHRDVSMVLQGEALAAHMTVELNIDAPLRTRQLTGAERAERVREVAQVLGLEELLHRMPPDLSGDQRQRVALARAFVHRPRAFLMDEPLSMLDAKQRAQTRAQLVELHKRVDTTVVYVTHDQIEAVTVANRVAILRDGRLQQLGTPKQIYDAPANLFVAQFIGTPPMNIVRGTFTGGAVEVGDSQVPVPSGLGTRLEDGRPLAVGLRPEHLRPSRDGAISMEFRAAEWLGHECLVRGEIERQPVVLRLVGMRPQDAQRAVRLDVNPASVHLFDPETTERLE